MTKELDQMREKLRAAFPAEAIKQRAGGGGRMLSYLEGHTVVHRLNDSCPAWDFAVVREWQDGTLLKAHVRLTIPGLGSREHVGVQVISDRAGTEDVAAKGHVTDGLKKAATLFGVGLELYGPDYAEEEAARAPAKFVRDPAPPAADDANPRMRKLHAAAKERGLDHAALHLIAQRFYDVPSMRGLDGRAIAGMTILVESFSGEEWAGLMAMILPVDPAGVKVLLGCALDIVGAQSTMRLTEIAREMKSAGISEEALRMIGTRRRAELVAREQATG